jgi:hypothetical protein
MAYARGQPLLVIIEAGIKSEGLLEHGYDWYVQWVELSPSALSTPEFNGVFASWKSKVEARATNPRPDQLLATRKPVADLTISELAGGLRPAQLWALLGSLAALIAGAVAIGAKLH